MRKKTMNDINNTDQIPTENSSASSADLSISPIKKHPKLGKKKQDSLVTTVSIRVASSDDKQIRNTAQELGISPNALMRYLIVYGMKQLEEGKISIPSFKQVKEVAA